VLQPSGGHRPRNTLLVTPKVRIPCRTAVENAKQKLDIITMHWMAEVYRQYDVTAYDVIDSSPQAGWNFLVIRSDEFLYPLDANPLIRLQLDLGTIFQRRTLPLTCLGYGRGGIVDKLSKYVHVGNLESQNFDRWCCCLHRSQ